jgi:hypothetical protein
VNNGALTFTATTTAATTVPTNSVLVLDAIVVGGVGQDILDFTSYGASFLQVFDVYANPGVSSTVIGSVGTPIAAPASNDPAQKYISLEHLASDAGGVYEIVLWENTNRNGTADYDTMTTGGDTKLGVIGIVDIGTDLTAADLAAGCIVI